MSAILKSNNYGKSKVRVLKVYRDTPVHKIKEFTVNISLEGDFQKVHTDGDNSKVLPTDTMKNTVYAIAKEDPVNSNEEFGLVLAKYFLENNKQVSRVKVEIEEKLWYRLTLQDPSGAGKQIRHDHSFISAGDEKQTAEIVVTDNSASVISGISDLVVLKTTDSGFENYIKDKFTTLKETSDRIFSTNVKADWSFKDEVKDLDYCEVSDTVREIILETFANHHSLSVQHTLYETGKNVIEKVKAIKEISLSMPNKHYLLFDLEQFGMENNNEIFVPVDEPYGLIQLTVNS